MKLLEKLCKIPAISGFEYMAKTEFFKIFEEFGLTPKTDNYGNIYAEKLSPNAEFNILIDAHLDEIGLIVSEILENGFVSFETVGGVDKKNLLCQEVEILGKEKVYGVIGAVPPHLSMGDKPDEQPLAIDTGVSAIAEIVKVGDPVKLKSSFVNLKNAQISSSAIDDRAGILCGLLVAKEFHQNTNLTILASAREETGLQGAKLFLQDKKFDLAIVLDVTHGYFDGLSSYRAFPVSEGFTLCYGGILQNNLVEQMRIYLDENKYQYHLEVEPSNPGTNAFSIVNYGIPTIMLSFPLKYMHTTVETVSQVDIENLAKFICEFDWKEKIQIC
jgi:endoglucanase